MRIGFLRYSFNVVLLVFPFSSSSGEVLRSSKMVGRFRVVSITRSQDYFPSLDRLREIMSAKQSGNEHTIEDFERETHG